MKGSLALPGELVFPEEDLDDAAHRVLEQLTGLTDIYMEQVYTFGKVDRHPDGRVITIAYYALVNTKDHPVKEMPGVEEIRWAPLKDALKTKLGFDHNDILEACAEKLKRRVRTAPIGFELLPEKFTLSELQTLYELILDKELDKRNFRKKILGMGVLNVLNEKQKGVAHRPANLYSFDIERYKRLVIDGSGFEL